MIVLCLDTYRRHEAVAFHFFPIAKVSVSEQEPVYLGCYGEAVLGIPSTAITSLCHSPSSDKSYPFPVYILTRLGRLARAGLLSVHVHVVVIWLHVRRRKCVFLEQPLDFIFDLPLRFFPPATT